MEARVKQEEQFIKKIKDEIEKKTGKTPEQLYEEREKRISDAVALKEPDRVPIVFRVGFFPSKYTGVPQSAPFYDAAAYKEAVIKTLVDFPADATCTVSARVSGLALDKLGAIQYKWPGGPLTPDQQPQFLDMAIMKENEYDLFMTDPGDFTLRYYLSRAWKSLAPLSKLPSLLSLVGSSTMATQSPRFNAPEVVQAFQTIFEAGRMQTEFAQMGEDISTIIGIPPLEFTGGIAAQPPYDLFASHLRGLDGTLVDMFKRPEKLLAGMEKMLDWQLARATPANPNKRRISAGGNHFSSEEFLSRKQFERFPWPTWKKQMLAAIDLGYIPEPFMEGKNDDRVECFLELPKGKAFIRFAQIDIVRAKEILGGHMCVIGGVPGSLLWGGSPQDVEEYCKNIIKVCGKGGGFILSCANADDAKPANLRAMVDSVKKYGQY